MQFRSQDDRDYANGAFISGAADFPAFWAEKASAFRESLGSRAKLGLAYGQEPRQRLDLFLPETKPKGLFVFVHGGYWMAFGRETWSHLAAGAITQGWACAMPSYTLAPDARVSAMTAEICQAVTVASQQVSGPVVVAGHSAGGHLAARMACEDGPACVTRVVPISPLADLRPLLRTEMNETLRLDEAEATQESPALLNRRNDVLAHVWVGGQERPAFLWQARLLSEDWDCPWTVDPGRHHFDVIDGLEAPESPLTLACLGGLA